MCDFLSIALPVSARETVSKWRRRGYSLIEHENRFLKQALSTKYVPWLLTTGGCSCGLCLRPSEAEQTFNPDKEIMLRANAIQIIRELTLAHGGSSYIYDHFYKGDVTTECLPLEKRDRRSIDTLHSDPIMRDTLILLNSKPVRPSAK